jgi:serine/threonine-protein kinase
MTRGLGSLAGRTLGHYRLTKTIGVGGMGIVYLAHDTRLDRNVAVKVLLPGLLADDAARRRFRKEALVLSRLNHPHIEIVHDFHTEDGIDYLVMEYVPGVTLRDMIADRSPTLPCCAWKMGCSATSISTAPACREPGSSARR